MKLIVSAIAAAALASFVSVTTAETADAAPRCSARVYATGVGQGILGKGTKRARARAISTWEAKVRRRDGARYASWRKATGKAVRCTRNIKRAMCNVSARPCR
ncbi:MAG: hypothetical protein KDJ41_15510 [Hyphomicrobiaceae bacterium]|nr:hypothetical protein [Hyphomicrobiaceae bacterium]